MVRVGLAAVVVLAACDPPAEHCDPGVIEVVYFDSSGVVDHFDCRPVPAGCSGIASGMECNVAACKQDIEGLCKAGYQASRCSDLDVPPSIECHR